MNGKQVINVADGFLSGSIRIELGLVTSSESTTYVNCPARVWIRKESPRWTSRNFGGNAPWLPIEAIDTELEVDTIEKLVFRGVRPHEQFP